MHLHFVNLSAFICATGYFRCSGGVTILQHTVERIASAAFVSCIGADVGLMVFVVQGIVYCVFLLRLLLGCENIPKALQV